MENGSLKIQLQNIHIRLTDNCNFKCSHCYAYTSDESRNELKLDAIYDTLESAKNLGCRSITLTGGEPLLYSKIDQLIDFLNKSDFTINIETNGYLIDFFLNKHGTDIIKNIHFKISYDHDLIRGKKNNKIVYKNLLALSEYQAIFTTQSIVTKEISEDLTDHLSSMKSLSMKSSKFYLNHDRINKGKDIKPMHYLQAIKLKRFIDGFDKRFNAILPGIFPGCKSANCGWGYTRLEIMPNGDYTSCAPISYYDNSFIAGNIYTDDLEDVWLNSKHFNSIRELTQGDYEYPCNICSEFSKCRGCCRAIGYSSSKKYLGTFPYCKEYYDDKNISFLLVKPDGVEHIDEIIRDLQNSNIEILRQLEIYLTKAQILSIYKNVDKVVVEKMLPYLLSGPVIVLIIKGNQIIREILKLTGDTVNDIADWDMKYSGSQKTMRTRYGKGFYDCMKKCYTNIPNSNECDLAIANSIHRPKSPKQIDEFFEILGLNEGDILSETYKKV